MPPYALLEWLHTLPFQPFRAHLADQTAFDVTLSELLIIGLGSADYYELVKTSGIPDIRHTATIAYRHISWLEKLPSMPVAATNGPPG
jgi:hypothetical protein